MMAPARVAGAAFGLAWLALVPVVDGDAAPKASGSSRNVTVTLVPEASGISPGRPLWVGLHFKLAPEWHTYWKNPGDAGLPIRVKWRLPEGFSAAAPAWPLPERFASGPLMSYGYAHEALLLTELRAPARTSGNEVRIGAQVDWLECQEACLPGKAQLEIAVPIASGAPRPLPEWAPAFRKFRERVPRVDASIDAEAAAQDSTLTLRVRGIPAPKHAYFFPARAEVLEHAAAQPLARDGSAFSLRLTRAANGALPDRIDGVLEADGIGYEIQAPVRPAP
jgi:thiol:disulfide interchange protein DsbD